MTVGNVTLVVRRLPEPRAVLALLKPVTWFPPMWAFGCGVVSAGRLDARWDALALGICVAGPLVCGASQAVNDWYDRHVDAINEPGRPIPSGRVPGTWGLRIALAWSALALAAGALLGAAGALATAGALAMAWAYSAPPLRFKQNGWIGNLAVGVSYESLAWITGAVVALGGALPGPRVLALAALYGLGAHGILTLNDFKAVAGDARMGVRSLPVQLGDARAARVACAVMLAPQVVVMALLATWGAVWALAGVAALVTVQLVLMRRFLADVTPRAAFVYSGVGVPFYVLGMLVSAAGVRALGGAA
ncbi:chlorophyll synthase ChlG [Roseisolibacter sp. H3M3-2]|uniref:chlorophyll synthase ChlG n=1 Tax=Roseisolibacter sp. H3M3-2 TaxID=3031323 RepID=UPI0023DC68B4|nr:chlorophyll synthase ChlG [Roseisolibacter sp. H3M3-2]MDF1501847.1 chlorophyll synthase ChlG [Roseisolibacter sp. H3M3-2]